MSTPATVTDLIPDWLNAGQFQKLLAENMPNFQQVKNFIAEPAIGAGENYQTVVLRIKIDAELKDGTSEERSYILKLPHNSDMFKMMMQFRNIFTIELNMYHEIIPDFEQLYREAGVPNKFAPQCYKVEMPSEFGVVLLEDLRQQGYKNVNRLEGLDEEHTEWALKKLAQFHAASAVRYERKGNYSDTYVIGIWNEHMKAMFEQMNAMSMQLLMQCMKSYEGHEDYYENVQNYLGKMLDEIFSFSKIDTNEFNVLNHGDYWSNNILFQYDAEGKVTNVMIIDYQLPKYGTPAQDLYYFLISSIKYELKMKSFDHLMKYYHDQLVENLTLLKYSKPLPTLRDLHIAMCKYVAFGFYTAVTIMGGALLDPTEIASAENFFSDSEAGTQFRMMLYANPRYKKHMEIILPWLKNRGAFE